MQSELQYAQMAPAMAVATALLGGVSGSCWSRPCKFSSAEDQTRHVK